MKELKAERRERIKKNQGKMAVRGRSIFTIQRIRIEKSLDAKRKAPQGGSFVAA